MTYATPELLLVGAAQHLVLGVQFYDSKEGCDFDAVVTDLSDKIELW